MHSRLLYRIYAQTHTRCTALVHMDTLCVQNCSLFEIAVAFDLLHGTHTHSLTHTYIRQYDQLLFQHNFLCHFCIAFALLWLGLLLICYVLPHSFSHSPSQSFALFQSSSFFVLMRFYNKNTAQKNE